MVHLLKIPYFFIFLKKKILVVEMSQLQGSNISKYLILILSSHGETFLYAIEMEIFLVKSHFLMGLGGLKAVTGLINDV